MLLGSCKLDFLFLGFDRIKLVEVGEDVIGILPCPAVRKVVVVRREESMLDSCVLLPDRPIPWTLIDEVQFDKGAGRRMTRHC